MRDELFKIAGLAEQLLNLALPMAHSPGTQAALLGASKAVMHGRRVKTLAVKGVKKVIKGIKRKRGLKPV